MIRVVRAFDRFLPAVSLVLAITSGSPAAPAAPAEAGARATHRIQLPGGEVGIGFDDFQYAAGARKILVPGGRTGKLFLLDPGTRQLTAIGGFSTKQEYSGGHGQGTTSSCEGGSLVYATDRGSKSVKIVDPTAGKIIGSIALEASPDYVRCVSATREVWVTEPGKEQIETFALGSDGRTASPAGTVKAAGGPESLVIDATRGRAYTHTWKSSTYAIDLKKRTIAATWTNGCQGARGGALDEKRGLLFVGCGEGKAVVMDVLSGKVLSSLTAGSDVDSIGYSEALEHLYVPGGGTADLSILDATDPAHLTLLGKVKTGPDAHTIAVDPEDHQVFVGLPEHGEVLVIPDAAGSAGR